MLAGFATTRAAPGESVQVSLTIPARLFARYDEDLAAWVTPGGEYTVHVGRSSRDLRLSTAVQVSGLYLTGHVPRFTGRHAACAGRARIVYHRIIL
jgi:hypothetical protein